MLGHWYSTKGEPPFTKKVMLRTLITDDFVYAPVMMYHISKHNRGTTLVCLACTHTERIQDFDGRIRNPRTLAAYASTFTPSTAVKLTYGQWRWSWNDSTRIDNLPQFVEEKGPEGRPAFGAS